VPLHSTILSWWHEAGGEAISFGSDAHDPDAIARGFRESVHMAEAHGVSRRPTTARTLEKDQLRSASCAWDLPSSGSHTAASRRVSSC